MEVFVHETSGFHEGEISKSRSGEKIEKSETSLVPGPWSEFAATNYANPGSLAHYR